MRYERWMFSIITLHVPVFDSNRNLSIGQKFYIEQTHCMFNIRPYRGWTWMTFQEGLHKLLVKQ